MNNYRFTLNNVDITLDILNFSYSESLDDVASSFYFESLRNFNITSTNNAGNQVVNILRVFDITTNVLVYLGVITDCEHTTDVNKYSYSGFDVGFYLNKNEVLIQFKNANITDAITLLSRENQINLGNVPRFKTTISKIYKDIVFADILKELLELEKTKGGLRNLYIDCKMGNLRINRYQIEQNLTALIGNGFLINSNNTYSAISVKHSIQELKNRVIYSDNNEKSIKKVLKDSPQSIYTYGLLTAIETVDTNKQNNLTKLANDKLKELNKIKEEINLSLISDYRVSKGKLIDFTINEYGLNGVYLITSAEHIIDSKKETVNVSIERLSN